MDPKLTEEQKAIRRLRADVREMMAICDRFRSRVRGIDEMCAKAIEEDWHRDRFKNWVREQTTSGREQIVSYPEEMKRR